MSAILMLRVAQGRSHWSSELRACVVTSTDEYKWCLLMRFISDFVLLGTMVLGVLRKRDPTHLWDMLYLQALFWISAAILSEVPDVVCHPYSYCCLVHRNESCFTIQIMPFININDAWNIIFQYPHLIVVAIASSRSYRDLIQHDQSRGSHLPRLISNSDAVGVLPRNGRAIQFAVGTTVEFDRDFIDLNNTVSSHANVGDDSEEGGSYSEHKKKKNMEA
ncbi:hypothetical protein BGW80DRAFT_519841 [Lactifluus volemus]|nr:hypothetical protein BGW80DRAFT_519841 [Lactifluus volemus]